MKSLLFLLHLTVVLFHYCQANLHEEQKCEVRLNERRVYCAFASAAQIPSEINKIVSVEPGILDLSFRESDVSNFSAIIRDHKEGVEKLALDGVHIGNSPTALSQLLAQFPKLELLRLDNSKEKITLTKDTFKPAQPILTLILDNNGLTDEDIEDDAFEHIKDSLKALTMRENQLTRLPSAITGLPDLRNLDFTQGIYGKNQVNYFSEENVKILRTLPQLETINLNDVACQCPLLRESFSVFVREKRVSHVICSQLSAFPGKEVKDIDVDAETSCKGESGPNDSNQMKIAALALIIVILPLLLV